MTDYLGYFAMTILVLSFTFKDMNKLRLWNAVACFLFLIYAILIDSIPILLSNLFIFLLNVFHLIKDRKKKPQ